MHENLPPGVNSGTSVLSKREISKIREIKFPRKFMSHAIKKAAKVETPFLLRWLLRLSFLHYFVKKRYLTVYLVLYFGKQLPT